MGNFDRFVTTGALGNAQARQARHRLCAPLQAISNDLQGPMAQALLVVADQWPRGQSSLGVPVVPDDG